MTNDQERRKVKGLKKKKKSGKTYKKSILENSRTEYNRKAKGT